MKVCKIVDEYRNALAGYLFCYEKSGAFTIELNEEMTAKAAPVFFESFISRGIYTVDPVFSLRWVENRIVPRDRQNLGTILRDSGLKDYDVLKLLLLAEGRCAQDDCAVFPVKGSQLPDWVRKRMSRRLCFAAALRPWELILMFNDGSMRRVDAAGLLASDQKKKYILSGEDRHSGVRLMPGGAGVEWSDGIFLTAGELYDEGVLLPLRKDEFDMMVRSYVVDTSDVCYELDCSRQYVSKLVRENGLEEFRATGSSRLFARSEIDRLRDE